MITRRDFIHTSALSAAGIALSASAPAPVAAQAQHIEKPGAASFWPDGSRLVISVSMQFEAGGQPDNAESPFPNNLIKGYRDLPAQTWYEYGYKEGIPRMLDLWDEFGIKVTSHMVGEAVQKNPKLARTIVERGHEAAAHGMSWSSQYNMTYDEEKKFIADGVEAVRQATGQSPKGYNANWLRRGENTLAYCRSSASPIT